MNTTRSAIRRTSPIIALAFALTLATQIPPAYAGIGTSPTFWLAGIDRDRPSNTLRPDA